MDLTPREKSCLERLRFAGADRPDNAVELHGIGDDTIWALWRFGLVDWVQWDSTKDPRRWYLRKAVK